MKTMYKVLAILIIAVSMLVIMPDNMSLAATAADAGSAIDGIQVTGGGDVSKLQSVIGKLLGFLQVASGIIAVLMIAITGFQYIVETPEVKSEIKKKMLPIIVDNPAIRDNVKATVVFSILSPFKNMFEYYFLV